MSIPPDFTLQENPQIAELLTALKYARRFLKPHEVDTGYIDTVIANAAAPAAQAHYRNELALDAAARTGETPLREHLPGVPGME
ncbi:hypothetical protein CAL26_05015 [Bordetella genomosp. 9]|uniref:Uncharacterized protein n=1 Tax=Bordetella genomosp. 9 TaxID=1416803 RepID=A0A261RNP7_9BORD|nr:hypothetical protein [Bordetella genomosp. 9]OZI26684.1 hypothetical protein CAL26_05015 [Bordetella genomosp. 9]